MQSGLVRILSVTSYRVPSYVDRYDGRNKVKNITIFIVR